MGDHMSHPKPTNPRESAEREQMLAQFRAAHRPGLERPHEGPPFPHPTLEYILQLPSETEQEKTAKHHAALVWLIQFCARARFVENIKGDLRLVLRTKPACAEKIDRVQQLLTREEIDDVLKNPRD